MTYTEIGKSIRRVDALAKVTGKAMYTGDFHKNGMLVGKVLRSPHAHAIVKTIDTTEAEKLPGVEAVLTYERVPQNLYATAGHPYSLEPKNRDVADKNILTKKARFVGDEIAAVVARDELTAEKALKLIKVEYELLKPVLDPEDALKEGAPLIHEENGSNIISSLGYECGDVEKSFAGSDNIFEDEFETSIVQHCHLENQVAYAYMDFSDRIVIVTPTQMPHACRAIVGEALGIPWGKVKIIKPYVGGGFGNKLDACIEPLVAAMTMAVGGRPVKLELTREECMIATRTRHAIKFKIKTGVSREGKLLAISIKAISNNGAYASHGHAPATFGGTVIRFLYRFKAIKYEPVTVYTNLPAAGAMRAYGVPQIAFALEAHLDNIARKLGIDPGELRKKNFIEVGYKDPINGNKVLSCGIRECVEKGKKLIRWEEKKAKYKEQKGNIRSGVGMACFSYGSGTYPARLEMSGARIVLNQDGSVQLQIGATELGQGSDTVFVQMAAEVLGIPTDMVHIVTTQDTDITPFAPGAYSSRQSYIAGMAVKKAATEVKEKILDFARGMTGIPVDTMDIKEANIIYKHSGEVVMPLSRVALESYYNTLSSRQITSDISYNARINTMSYGVTFAEVEVDIKTGKIEIVEIYNIHDSGKIINPLMAEGQVHGGVSMAIGYALAEQLLFDEKTGKPRNNNLLDYKLPTILDTPDIGVAFVETDDPTGPFGNKSLGEPPAISPAPAIRNAVLDATGVKFNRLPMNPQRVFEKFREEGLV
jgi:xanthine dehydrogenase molybdenum-binding subunit